MAEVRLARSAGGSIAYQVVGEGPALAFVPNWATNMEALDLTVETRDFFERLAQSCRFITFDHRGSGLSDRGSVAHDIDAWLDDLDAVLDAAGADRVTLLSQDFSGPLALTYAARRRDRVQGVILIGSFARIMQAPGYDIGVPADHRDLAIAMIVDGWGSPTSQFAHLGVRGPARAAAREKVARIQRLSSNRNEIAPLVDAVFDLDVRALLPEVRAPVLLLHAQRDALVPPSTSRFLAEALPDARLVELDSDIHYPFFEDAEVALDEILAFVGAAPAGRSGRRELAVVWFSDIVSSTAHLRELGDRRWAQRLDEHDQLVDFYLQSFRGELVKRLGDGVLALFRSASDAALCARRFAAGCHRAGLAVRVGLHAGDVERRSDGDVAGLAVHAAQRIEAAARPGEIWVSSTLRDLVAGSALGFRSEGSHELRGLGGPTELFSLGG